MTYLPRPLLPHLVASGLLLILLIGGCTQPADLVPEPPRPADRYTLSHLRYFLGAGDGIDTTTITLPGASVRNPGNAPDTQQVANSFDQLVKTSQFTVIRPPALPGNVELSAVTAQVPQHWNGNDSFLYFSAPFPLTDTPQQKPYNGFNNTPMAVRVPPKSRIDVSRQVEAHQLTCSFEAVLENETTGQRYPLTGKWTGLLRYQNVSVSLTQSPLP